MSAHPTSLTGTAMREAGAMERLMANLASENRPFTPSTTVRDDSGSSYSSLGPGGQAVETFSTSGPGPYWGASEQWRSEQPKWVTG